MKQVMLPRGRASATADFAIGFLLDRIMLRALLVARQPTCIEVRP